jgi:hypothetical protein
VSTPDLAGVGRLLVFIGAGLLVLGMVFMLSDRIPLLGWLGRLPGDLIFRRGNTTVIIPIATSILLSLVLSIVLSLILRR